MLRNGKSGHLGLDALFLYMGNAVQASAGMLFYFIIMKIYNTAQVGTLAIFLAIIGLFSTIFTFGLNIAAEHFTSYNIGLRNLVLARKTIYKIVLMALILSLIGFFTLFMISNVISTLFLHTIKYTSLIRLLGIDVVGMVLFSVLNGVLIGMQYFRLSAVINILIWLIYYLLSIVLVLYRHSIKFIIIGWIIGIFLGVVLTGFLIMKLLSYYNGNVDSSTLSNKIILKFSTPVVLSAIVSYGSSYVDRFVLAGLMSLSSIGIYNLALLIAGGVAFITPPFNSILMSKLSEYFGMGSKEKVSEIVKASVLFLYWLYVPAAIGTAALSPLAIGILGGQQYLNGSIPLSIILITSAIFVSRTVLLRTMASVRKTSIFIYSSTIALFFNILLSILLIPKFGLIGASIGFSSIYGTTFITAVYFTKKEHIESFDILGILKVWISSICMYFWLLLLISLFGTNLLLLPLYLISGGIIYISTAKLLRVFNSKNRTILESVFPNSDGKLRKILNFLVLS